MGRKLGKSLASSRVGWTMKFSRKLSWSMGYSGLEKNREEAHWEGWRCWGGQEVQGNFGSYEKS